MQFPLSLIKSFLPLDMPPAKIGEVLTLLGIEVDHIHEGQDPIFELSLTPNLGHCMSALGIARELSAALQIPLHKSKTAPLPSASLSKEIVIHDHSFSPRYMCCLIEGIQVGPSPAWLTAQLEACGQKPINNVVDTANYVMMKLGQPMHAFDYDLLEGNKLEVGPSKHAQKFLGLDGIERDVPAGALLISDARKPVAIAGIMGGANSAVSEKTTRVLLEAASFDPISIRTTSRKIGLRTDSSQRFEKGVDPVGISDALSEACQLLGGAYKGGIDLKKGSFTPKKIHYRPERINHLLGTKLSVSEIEEIFERLQFKVATPYVEIPLYRSDINEEIDLVEEVARIYGYNNIEKSAAHCVPSQIPNDPVFVFENKLRHQLAGFGLTEFLNCDLISPKLAEVAKAITPSSMAFLQAAYSKSEEYSVLRTSLLPGLLQVTQRNLDQKNHDIAAFEIGRIHFLQNSKVTEVPMGAILLTGKATLPHWSHKAADVDYFDLKGLVENLLYSTFQPSNHLTFHPGRQADIRVGDLTIGSLGEVHPNFLQKFNINQRVYYAEFDLIHLLNLKKIRPKFTALPQFPASERDWTVPLPLNTPIETIFKTIYDFNSPLLEHIELLDLYLPESSPQKNATFRFTYRDPAKTISFEEVEKAHTALLAHITSKI
jgi:phenylalanyl-tRNA synthetase beta chain